MELLGEVENMGFGFMGEGSEEGGSLLRKSSSRDSSSESPNFVNLEGKSVDSLGFEHLFRVFYIWQTH